MAYKTFSTPPPPKLPELSILLLIKLKSSKNAMPPNLYKWVLKDMYKNVHSIIRENNPKPETTQ